MPRVPYNPSHRLGRGFLTYDQTPKMLDAVIFSSANVESGVQRDDVEYNEVILTDPNSKTVGEPAPTATTPDNTKQIVNYSLKMVEKASNVTDSLNISAALALNDGGISASGSGSYIDSTAVKSSDVNFMVTVTVINDFRSVPFDATLSPWPMSDSKDVFPQWLVGSDRGPQLFTDIYGDSFVSGHHIGGQFSALVNIHTEDTQKQQDIKAKVAFSLSMISGNGDFGKLSDSGISDSDTTITVTWQGGGQIKDPATAWSMDTMIDVAKTFPLKVAQNPAVFATEVTEYTYLKDYWVKFGQHNLKPVDFGLARWLTSKLLDSFVDYKHIVDLIDRMLKSYPNHLKLKDGQTTMPTREAIVTERMNSLTAMLQMRDWVSILKDGSKTYSIKDVFNFEDPNVLASRLPHYEKPKKTVPGQAIVSTISTWTPILAQGTYNIVNALTGTVLNMGGARKDNGAPICGFARQPGNTTEQWVVTPTGSDTFTIKNVNTNNYASYVQTSKDPKWNYLQSNTQPVDWLLVPGTVAGAHYILTTSPDASTKGFRLDLASSSAANDNPVIIWHPNDAASSVNQQWKFELAT